MSMHSRPPRFSRREALGILGAGAAAVVLPKHATAAPTFPKGAIIRTILKDYARRGSRRRRDAVPRAHVAGSGFYAAMDGFGARDSRSQRPACRSGDARAGLRQPAPAQPDGRLLHAGRGLHG